MVEGERGCFVIAEVECGRYEPILVVVRCCAVHFGVMVVCFAIPVVRAAHVYRSKFAKRRIECFGITHRLALGRFAFAGFGIEFQTDKVGVVVGVAKGGVVCGIVATTCADVIHRCARYLCCHGAVGKYMVDEFAATVAMRKRCRVVRQKSFLVAGIDQHLQWLFAHFAVQVAQNQNVGVGGDA